MRDRAGILDVHSERMVISMSPVYKTKLIEMDGGLGVVLPASVLQKWGAVKGDDLLVLESAEGITLSLSESKFAKQLAEAERIMLEDHDLLQKLAE